MLSMQAVYKWRDTDIENEVDFMQKVVHSIRSARSDYNLPSKTKTEGEYYFYYKMLRSIIFLIE